MDFHFIIARRHGEPFAYAIGAAFDTAGLLGLSRQYDELTGPSAATLAADNAELLFASLDGETLNVRHSHHFADPADVERRRKSMALEEARRIRDENTAAQLAAEQAIDKVEETQKRVQSLSEDQKALLEEFDAEQKRIADSRAQKESVTAHENAEAAAARARSLADQKAAATDSAASSTQGLHDATIAPAAPVESLPSSPAPEAPVPGPALPLP